MTEIPDYEGLYSITPEGCIWSHKYKIWMKRKVDRAGYWNIGLYKNHASKSWLVHRLVALTFIPNPLEYSQVNHIDGNPLNNHISNLEWCTPSYNVKHAYDTLGRVPPWKGKKRPEIKDFFTSYKPGNIPWNKDVKVGKYIPRKREVVIDPTCPNCGLRKRWIIDTFPDGLKRYQRICNVCALQREKGEV